jgi:hypothetical protein
MPDNDMLGKFTKSINTGSGDGIELSTLKLSATKLNVNVPVPVLVKFHELTPVTVLKCNDGDARTGDTINAITATKINFFIFIILYIFSELSFPAKMPDFLLKQFKP